MTRSARIALALAAVLTACGEDRATQPTERSSILDQHGNPCGGGVAVTLGATTAPLGAVGRGAVVDRYTAELWVRGSTAYTTTWGRRNGTNVGNEVKIWDVSGAAPTPVGCLSVSGAGTTGDVQVSDDGALLVVATEYSPGSIVVYDLTADPRHPKELSRFSSATTAPGVHTAEVQRVNGTLYAFLSVDPSSAAAARLVVVSLADPAAPAEVFSAVMGDPYVHDVFVRDGLLFTALWNGGMAIWDVGGGGKGGTPAAPVRIGGVQTAGGHVHNIWWYHDAQGGARYAFVGEENGPAQLGATSAGDVHVVELSDLAAPREVAFYHVPGAGTHNFSVDEQRGVLYAAYYNGGVRAIDVRGDLSACTAAQRSADGRCDLGLMGRELAAGLTDVANRYVWGVQYVEPYVYASDMVNGLWKLNAVRP